MKWEQEYIDAAEKAFRDQYQKNYAPLPEIELPEETEEEDEMIKHIYKRHKVEKRDELELYFAKSDVNFDKNMDILAWWKVCNRNIAFLASKNLLNYNYSCTKSSFQISRRWPETFLRCQVSIHYCVFIRKLILTFEYIYIATSVPIERVFSGGTDLITPKRCSLNAEVIRACMCLKSWWGEQN